MNLKQLSQNLIKKRIFSFKDVYSLPDAVDKISKKNIKHLIKKNFEDFL